MLSYELIHPEILAAVASAGHGSKILIADGNYPLSTGTNPLARRVYLNLRPGVVNVIEVLEALLQAVPVEAASVMQPAEGLPEPAIFGQFSALLPATMTLERLERFAFYAASRTPDVALAIATGEQRIYANILLTIGVRLPSA